MQRRGLTPPPPGAAGAAHQAEPLSRRLAEIVATAMDGIVTVDAAQCIVLFNEAAGHMFRRTAAETLGQPLDILIPPAQRGAHHLHVQQYGEGPSPARRMGLVRALSGVRSDGTEFPIEATISRVGTGADLLMTVMVRDVTEVREAEAARQARIATEAAELAKDQFLSRMSHELRTPLNAVLGITQLLRARASQTPDDARQLDVLHDAGLQLLALIEQMLAIGQHTGGGPKAPSAAPHAPAPAPAGTVLYIEDNAVNALLVVELLRQWPQVDVVIAETGAEGLQQARDLQPALVLLDMRLPDMTGQQLLAALRTDPHTRSLDVVALSANAMPLDVQSALDAGAIAYWTKPIDFTAFLANVHALLVAAAARQRASTVGPPPA